MWYFDIENHNASEDITNSFTTAFQRYVAKNNKWSKDYYSSGRLKKDSIKLILEKAGNYGLRIFHEKLISSARSTATIILVSENTTFNIQYDKRHGWFRLISTEEKIFDELSLFVESTFKPAATKDPLLYTCAYDYQKNLVFRKLGAPAKKLVEENYTKEVINQFKIAIEEIGKKEPRGRLLILRGVPGTGKTFLLRAVIGKKPNTNYIFIQPEIISKFNSIQLIDALMNHFDKKTVVLLIEDADSCIGDRRHNDEDTVSKILNMTDGFLGELLDIHVVATTNLSELDIDMALRRSGRLNDFIHISELSPEQANIAYQKITLDNKDLNYVFNKPTVLADVYAKANGKGKEEINKTRIGFKVASNG